MKKKLLPLLALSAIALLGASCSLSASTPSPSGSASQSPTSEPTSSLVASSEDSPSSSEEAVSSAIDSNQASVEESSEPTAPSEPLATSESAATSEPAATSEAVTTSEATQTTSEGVTTSEATSEPSETTSEPSASSGEAPSSSVDESSLPTHGGTFDNSAFSILRSDGLVPAFDSGMYKIYEGGTYDLTGTLVGMVFVNVSEEEEVVLNLNGVNLSYAENAVIYCLSADKLEISAKKGTENTFTDLRDRETVEDELQGGGVLYSKVDTKLKGNGSLTVVGTYNNGIHVTKDLEIKNLTLKSSAVNHAIKGNDSITVESGNVTAISSGGDGLKTSDSDVSSKGNQRGDIAILGGTVNVYSAADGLDAAHDVIVGSSSDPEAAPEISVVTNKYSSYTNASDITNASESLLYLRTVTNANYRYAVYFYNNGASGQWQDVSFVTSAQQGRSTYYYYSVERPSEYSSFAIYAFASTSTVNSLTDYALKSSGSTVNTNYDTITFSIGSSSITTGSWINYPFASTSQVSAFAPGGPGGGGPGGGFPGGGGFAGQEGNTDKADGSAKGLKAANEVNVYGGKISIKAYDDGIHANYGDTLENGETGQGNVNILGGEISIYASDDGIRADKDLNISGGTIDVTYAYEGLEANQINITGGHTSVLGTDDGVNVSTSTLVTATPNLTVSGGYLAAFVPTSGDVDGIDSNGNFTVTGGTVISCGPNQGMASALDVDKTAKVTGGTFIIFGGAETTPTYTGVTYSTANGSFAQGSTHTVTLASGTVTTPEFPYTYSGVKAWSELGSIYSAS